MSSCSRTSPTALSDSIPGKPSRFPTFFGHRKAAKKKAPADFNGGGLARRFWGLGAEPPISRSVAPELHREVNGPFVQSEPYDRWRQKRPTFSSSAASDRRRSGPPIQPGAAQRETRTLTHCESERGPR